VSVHRGGFQPSLLAIIREMRGAEKSKSAKIGLSSSLTLGKPNILEPVSRTQAPPKTSQDPHLLEPVSRTQATPSHLKPPQATPSHPKPPKVCRCSYSLKERSSAMCHVGVHTAPQPPKEGRLTLGKGAEGRTKKNENSLKYRIVRNLCSAKKIGLTFSSTMSVFIPRTPRHPPRYPF